MGQACVCPARKHKVHVQHKANGVRLFDGKYEAEPTIDRNLEPVTAETGAPRYQVIKRHLCLRPYDDTLPQTSGPMSSELVLSEAETCRVLSIRDVVQDSTGKYFEVQLKQLPERKAAVGDRIYIRPKNAAADVERLAKMYKVDSDAQMNRYFQLVLVSENETTGAVESEQYFETFRFSLPSNFRQVFSSEIDLSAPPSLSLLKAIGVEVELPSALQAASLGNNAQAFEHWIHEGKPTLLSLLESLLPGELPSIECLLTSAALIAPRCYLICAADSEKFAFCYRTLHIQSNNHRQGLCTGFLRSLNTGDRLQISLRHDETKLTPPSDPAVPVFMFASDVGVSPFVGFLANADTGLLSDRIYLLYEFNKAREAPYFLEISNFEKHGVLKDVLLEPVAEDPGKEGTLLAKSFFSNRQWMKIVRELVEREAAQIYVCGSERFCDHIHAVLEMLFEKRELERFNWYHEERLKIGILIENEYTEPKNQLLLSPGTHGTFVPARRYSIVPVKPGEQQQKHQTEFKMETFPAKSGQPITSQRASTLPPHFIADSRSMHVADADEEGLDEEEPVVMEPLGSNRDLTPEKIQSDPRTLAAVSDPSSDRRKSTGTILQRASIPGRRFSVSSPLKVGSKLIDDENMSEPSNGYRTTFVGSTLNDSVLLPELSLGFQSSPKPLKPKMLREYPEDYFVSPASICTHCGGRSKSVDNLTVAGRLSPGYTLLPTQNSIASKQRAIPYGPALILPMHRHEPTQYHRTIRQNHRPEGLAGMVNDGERTYHAVPVFITKMSDNHLYYKYRNHGCNNEHYRFSHAQSKPRIRTRSDGHSSMSSTTESTSDSDGELADYLEPVTIPRASPGSYNYRYLSGSGSGSGSGISPKARFNNNLTATTIRNNSYWRPPQNAFNTTSYVTKSKESYAKKTTYNTVEDWYQQRRKTPFRVETTVSAPVAIFPRPAPENAALGEDESCNQKKKGHKNGDEHVVPMKIVPESAFSESSAGSTKEQKDEEDGKSELVSVRQRTHHKWSTVDYDDKGATYKKLRIKETKSPLYHKLKYEKVERLLPGAREANANELLDLRMSKTSPTDRRFNHSMPNLYIQTTSGTRKLSANSTSSGTSSTSFVVPEVKLTKAEDAEDVSIQNIPNVQLLKRSGFSESQPPSVNLQVQIQPRSLGKFEEASDLSNRFYVENQRLLEQQNQLQSDALVIDDNHKTYNSSITISSLTHGSMDSMRRSLSSEHLPSQERLIFDTRQLFPSRSSLDLTSNRVIRSPNGAVTGNSNNSTDRLVFDSRELNLENGNKLQNNNMVAFVESINDVPVLHYDRMNQQFTEISGSADLTTQSNTEYPTTTVDSINARKYVGAHPVVQPLSIVETSSLSITPQVGVLPVSQESSKNDQIMESGVDDIWKDEFFSSTSPVRTPEEPNHMTTSQPIKSVRFSTSVSDDDDNAVTEIIPLLCCSQQEMDQVLNESLLPRIRRRPPPIPPSDTNIISIKTGENNFADLPEAVGERETEFWLSELKTAQEPEPSFTSELDLKPAPKFSIIPADEESTYLVPETQESLLRFENLEPNLLRPEAPESIHIPSRQLSHENLSLLNLMPVVSDAEPVPIDALKSDQRSNVYSQPAFLLGTGAEEVCEDSSLIFYQKPVDGQLEDTLVDIDIPVGFISEPSVIHDFVNNREENDAAIYKTHENVADDMLPQTLSYDHQLSGDLPSITVQDAVVSTLDSEDTIKTTLRHDQASTACLSELYLEDAPIRLLEPEPQAHGILEDATEKEQVAEALWPVPLDQIPSSDADDTFPESIDDDLSEYRIRRQCYACADTHSLDSDVQLREEIPVLRRESGVVAPVPTLDVLSPLDLRYHAGQQCLELSSSDDDDKDRSGIGIAKILRYERQVSGEVPPIVRFRVGAEDGIDSIGIPTSRNGQKTTGYGSNVELVPHLLCLDVLKGAEIPRAENLSFDFDNLDNAALASHGFAVEEKHEHGQKHNSSFLEGQESDSEQKPQSQSVFDTPEIEASTMIPGKPDFEQSVFPSTDYQGVKSAVSNVQIETQPVDFANKKFVFDSREFLRHSVDYTRPPEFPEISLPTNAGVNKLALPLLKLQPELGDLLTNTDMYLDDFASLSPSIAGARDARDFQGLLTIQRRKEALLRHRDEEITTMRTFVKHRRLSLPLRRLDSSIVALSSIAPGLSPVTSRNHLKDAAAQTESAAERELLATFQETRRLQHISATKVVDETMETISGCKKCATPKQDAATQASVEEQRSVTEQQQLQQPGIKYVSITPAAMHADLLCGHQVEQPRLIYARNATAPAVGVLNQEAYRQQLRIDTNNSYISSQLGPGGHLLSIASHQDQPSSNTITFPYSQPTSEDERVSAVFSPTASMPLSMSGTCTPDSGLVGSPPIGSMEDSPSFANTSGPSQLLIVPTSNDSTTSATRQLAFNLHFRVVLDSDSNSNNDSNRTKTTTESSPLKQRLHNERLI